MELDEIDHIILNELQADGRRSNVDLAERIGLSPSACLRRVRRLEDDGVIDRYAMLIDPVAIGRPTSVFIEISLRSQEESSLDAFEAAVADIPEVMSCYLMAGDADYLIHVRCADVADYERIHRTQMAILPGVDRIQSRFALRTVCQETRYRL